MKGLITIDIMPKDIMLGCRVTENMAQEFADTCEYWAFKRKIEREENGRVKIAIGLRKAIEWFILWSKKEIEQDEAFQTFIERRKENAGRILKKKKPKKAEAQPEEETTNGDIEINGPEDEEYIDDTEEIVPDYTDLPGRVKSDA